MPRIQVSVTCRKHQLGSPNDWTLHDQSQHSSILRKHWSNARGYLHHKSSTCINYLLIAFMNDQLGLVSREFFLDKHTNTEICSKKRLSQNWNSVFIYSPSCISSFISYFYAAQKETDGCTGRFLSFKCIEFGLKLDLKVPLMSILPQRKRTLRISEFIETTSWTQESVDQISQTIFFYNQNSYLIEISNSFKLFCYTFLTQEPTHLF